MPLAKEDIAEYQRLRRAANYACMGCGEVGKASERYRAAATEIRRCKSFYAKITAALLPAAQPIAQPTATPADPVVGLSDIYEARQAIFDGDYSLNHPTKMAMGKAMRDRMEI